MAKKNDLPVVAGFNPDKKCKVIFQSDCGKKKVIIDIAIDSTSEQMMAIPTYEPELVPGSKMEIYAGYALKFFTSLQNQQ